MNSPANIPLMRTTILTLGLILTASFVFADDKKSGNELKVKINHEYEYKTNSASENIQEAILKEFDKNGDGKIGGNERPSREVMRKFVTGLAGIEDVRNARRRRTIQFNYDTEEWLHITNRPEGYEGIYLRRNEVAKFKAIVEKMLKFGNAVYDNQITGVKKTFIGESAILPMKVHTGTYIDIQEKVAKPFSKADVKVYWATDLPETWDLVDLEEIAKVFDEKQKEVFKKYDLLKALND
tara:strand:- start:565 stop:1281 length:717 start_codon:yes stop_codon:yes gene_type:complete